MYIIFFKNEEKNQFDECCIICVVFECNVKYLEGSERIPPNKCFVGFFLLLNPFSVYLCVRVVQKSEHKPAFVSLKFNAVKK